MVILSKATRNSGASGFSDVCGIDTLFWRKVTFSVCLLATYCSSASSLATSGNV